MKGLGILLVLVLSSVSYGQCPGGVCRSPLQKTEPAKKKVSVLVKPVATTVQVTRQRIERRPFLRRIFRRGC